jgi:aspartate carbamoyltransferase catalytic subunit
METLAALGAGSIVLRHSQDGLHGEVARYLDAEWPHVRLINAGEGTTHHPTQALADAYTLWNCHQGRNNEGPYGFAGKRILIVGDSRKSRVARSTTTVFKTLGATVSLCGPVEWLPNLEDPVFVGCQRHTVLNDALSGVDAIMTLRVQTERGSGVTDAWIAAYQLTPERLQKTKKTPESLPAWVLHPGPVNWGVELHPQFRFGQSHKGQVVNPTQTVLIRQQVAHGVSVRQVLLQGV